MRKDSDLHIRIERDLNDRFKEYSKVTGVKQSEYLRAYIRCLVNDPKTRKCKHLETIAE